MPNCAGVSPFTSGSRLRTRCSRIAISVNRSRVSCRRAGSASSNSNSFPSTPTSRSANRASWRKTEIEIFVHRRHQLGHLVLEEMVRTLDLIVMDRDVLLRSQFVDELLHRDGRHDLV